MILTNLFDNRNIEFELADKIIKNYFPEAIYFRKFKNYTYVLYIDNSPIREGYKYTRYKDGNNIYNSFATNEYKELKEKMSLLKYKPLQLELELF